MVMTCSLSSQTQPHMKYLQDLSGLGDRQTHVSYTVLATKGIAPLSSTSTITTRYSTVAALADVLPLPRDITALLPKRQWFGDHFAQDFESDRRARLERFLQAICNHPVSSCCCRFTLTIVLVFRLTRPSRSHAMQVRKSSHEYACYLHGRST